MLKKWEDLPSRLQCPEVREYYDILSQKKISLILKRALDMIGALFVLLVTAVPMLVIAVLVKLDSKGSVLYRQERVTAYGKRFRIHKFRTMTEHADRLGAAVTVSEDPRITALGKKLRRLRLDELPQVFDVLSGNMSFVGTRPEAAKYVESYSSEMYATLLLPAGITSSASILYRNEAELLDGAENADRTYIETILPEKMKINLQDIREFSLRRDLAICLKTVAAVFSKNDGAAPKERGKCN